jgi:hypothetical protein
MLNSTRDLRRARYGPISEVHRSLRAMLRCSKLYCEFSSWAFSSELMAFQHFHRHCPQARASASERKLYCSDREPGPSEGLPTDRMMLAGLRRPRLTASGHTNFLGRTVGASTDHGLVLLNHA